MPEAREGEFVFCAFCDGRGERSHSGDPCPVCKGVGKFIIPDNKKWVKCSFCDGRGERSHSGDPCPTCKGIGKVW